MTNTVIVLKNIYNESIRVFADHIVSYEKNGMFTNLQTTAGTLQVITPVEILDQIMSEIYFMVKKYEDGEVDQTNA